MGLNLARLLSTASEWWWLGRCFLWLPSAPPAISKRSPTGLRTRALPPTSKYVWWPQSGSRWYPQNVIMEDRDHDIASGIGALSPDLVQCTVTFSADHPYNGLKMSAEKLFIRSIKVSSELCESIKKKWQIAEDTVEELTMTLQRRNNQVRELGGIIHELHMTTSQHQRRIELQRNQLEEQEGMLLEMYVALQMRDSGPHSIIAQELGTRLRHTSKEYWLLRKHRMNLVKVTKPIIQSVIKSSYAAGLVSSSIGACALNCSSQDHDCTEEFYKALQVTVSERPEAFTQFLEILNDNSGFPSCQQMCQMIWKQLVPS